MYELFLGAGLAIGLAGIGVGIGEGILAQKSIEAFGKNKELGNSLQSFTILGIALVESAAIYGLAVALIILFVVDPASAGIGWKAIAAGTAVGAAGMGAGIGEGFLVGGAIDSILRNPELEKEIRTKTILFLALVESVAIYGLAVALILLFVV
jgi:ATP synthase F0 subunit c